MSHLGYVSKRETITTTRALEHQFGVTCSPPKGTELGKTPMNPRTEFSTKRGSIIEVQVSLVDSKKPQEFK